jgi:hypothetical protein
MAFFNKREEVLDIQLTQYGKYKLSQGELKPEYYAFFDDDILYDRKYGDSATDENQNDIKDRIKETIRTKTQHLHYGVGSLQSGSVAQIRDTIPTENLGYGEDLELERRLAEPVQVHFDKFYSLTCPIGTSEMGNQSQPRWKIDLLAGNFSGSSTPEISYSQLGANKTPVLNIDSTYATSFVIGSDSDEFFESEENVIFGTYESFDGTIVAARLEKDEIIISFNEENTGGSLLENYDLEVFIRDQGQEEVDFRQLYFAEQGTMKLVKDGILQDIKAEVEPEEFAGITPEEVVLDPNAVEFYLDITADAEIDSEVMCRYLQGEKITDIYTQTQFNCRQTLSNSNRPNIYRTEDYEDPCDE